MHGNLWKETHSGMAADWDLCAVVKSFSATLAANHYNYNNNTTPEEDHPIPQGLAALVSQQNDLFPSNMASFDELHEACNPFVPFSQPINPNITTTSSTNISNILPQPLKKPRPYYYRKKKAQPSKVVEVAAENLQGVDPWCWRKYGQKPIKGTPHPRSYYKCSSDNNKCPARKHVERSQTDPNVFIVSYEGGHTHSLPIHRNPLSGSTRISKWGSGLGSGSSSPSIVTTTSTSSSSATTLSPLPEPSMDVKRDGEEDGEVEMISNLVLAEDILMGFRELGGN